MFEKLNDIFGPWWRWLWLLVFPAVFVVWVLGYLDYLQAYEPPAQILGVIDRRDAAPGEWAQITIRVDRRPALERGCNAIVDKYLIDSRAGSPMTIPRLDLPDNLLRLRAQYSPSKAQIDFQVPLQAVPGPANYLYWIKYHCSIWHQLFGPVVVSGSIPIEILEKAR